MTTHWHIALFEKGTNNVIDCEVAFSYSSERHATQELADRQLVQQWPGNGTNFGVLACDGHDSYDQSED